MTHEYSPEKEERNRRNLRFAGIYIASLLLLFLILYAFGVHLTTNDKNTQEAYDAFQVKVDMEQLHADSLLHAQLLNMQQTEASAVLMPDSASKTQKNNAAVAAAHAKAALKKSIDSIQQVASYYAGATAVKYTAMLNSFTAVLNDRVMVASAQALTMAGKGSALTTGQQEMLSWKYELVLKENDISRLQAEIKALQAQKSGTASMVPTKSSGLHEAQKGENELLKTAFADQQKELDALKEKYNRIKTDNGAITAQLAEAKKPVAPTDNARTADAKAMDSKINMLQQKVQELNADLNFARIDCNLARTDVQQMISNARQRKELLSESLTMLTGLSNSENADIQKKAKEKIARLNRIASTLHD